MLKIYEKKLKEPQVRSLNSQGRVKKVMSLKNPLIKRGEYMLEKSEKIKVTLEQKKKMEEKKRQAKLNKMAFIWQGPN